MEPHSPKHSLALCVNATTNQQQLQVQGGLSLVATTAERQGSFAESNDCRDHGITASHMSRGSGGVDAWLSERQAWEGTADHYETNGGESKTWEGTADNEETVTENNLDDANANTNLAVGERARGVGERGRRISGGHGNGMREGGREGDGRRGRGDSRMRKGGGNLLCHQHQHLEHLHP